MFAPNRFSSFWKGSDRIRKGLALGFLVTSILTVWISVRLVICTNHYALLETLSGFRRTFPEFREMSAPSNHVFYISHTFEPAGGLGNKMFVYAALYGIAGRNNLSIAIERNILHNNTHVGLETVGAFSMKDSNNFVFGISPCCTYDQKTDELLFAPSERKNVLLWGYLQSWKYFHPLYRNEIREQFRFTSEISQRADAARTQVLDQIYQKLSPNDTRTRPVVGVHVRRGDVLTPRWLDLGTVEIPKSYFANAERYLVSKGIVDPLYVVCTNDPDWAQANLSFRLMGIVRNQTAEVDMDILSRSDHLILSYGTFSFWAAYRSNATSVIYYADYPRPASRIGNETKLSDLWLPEWVGVGP